MRRPGNTLAPLALCLAVGAQLASASPVGAARIALLTVQNPAGDGRAATAVTEALGRELAARGDLIEETATRDALRRLRVRDGEKVAPELLRELARDLSADWMVSATVHDVERRHVPRLTLSARAYDGATGLMFWAGFEGGSGLDRRKLLGLGVIAAAEDLAPRVVKALLSDLPAGAAAPEVGGGAIAVVDFDGLTEYRAVAASDTLTAAAQAALHARGLRLASPNCTSSALRRARALRRGAVDSAMRDVLVASCQATGILTGTVEVYDVGGSEEEPDPRVALSLRLLDTETGRILWNDSLERRGWEHGGPFRLRRIYSRGALVERMMETLTKRLTDRTNIG